MIYDVDYFIKKFEAIPEEKWTVKKYVDKTHRRCAIGHCGDIDGIESHCLRDLFLKIGLIVACVNDDISIEFPQDNPRGRILAALYKIKGKQNEST